MLRDGLEALGLPLEDRQIHALFAYLALLQQWNHAYNLTAIRDPEMMVTHHLLDSLSIARRVKGMRIIDVGTGPGLPGIPLAICFPERQFSLLDSNGKKTRFLFQVKTTLGLDNVQQRQSRAETYRPEQPFDAVISRAFTSLAGMTESCAHLLSKHGRFYAMKGQYPEQELSELPKHYNVVGSHRLVVPGIEGHRHLIEIAPA
ncbi:16S rRNA (guanine(527)-N(7))-methyltransferase RsmG [uncultured Porticoccus sp.]|uniref:16S rRNA (guanine(527)-N(7))-methyltransferase RsmG n=1 Tax=uncultured Porticoccus sp. TaxID=1256050 RepID=UPI0026334358|nr:16S rRNA (guanine(527)-N(7))-methyltransferase RsmG [uncultured Porticoccus sp.]